MPSRRMMMAYIMSHQSRLPAEFQEVEYLESTGTQYIDTGFTPNQDSGLEIEYQNTELNATATGIIGTRRTSLDTNEQGFGVGYRGSGLILAQYGDEKTPTQNISSDDLLKHIEVLDKNVFYRDDVLIQTFTQQTFDGYGDLFIFRWNSGILADKNIAKMKLYSCKLYNNSVLVRDFVPCYRKADNVAGLYDLVNGVFYTNAGTGDFIVGGNV